MPLNPGTLLGTYEILSLIGAGGMGEVYKARDPKLNRLVAIKVLPADLAGNADLLARFEREAKAVAALSHPNVLGIYDIASQGGHTYAVMELLEGENLRDRMRGGALQPKRAVEIAVELAQGLGAAHARGIVHRDVKPENIFLTREGRVKVLDFGLAKQVAGSKAGSANLDTEALSNLKHPTEAGVVLGTAGYMSPEQVRGEPADHRADIFAFGVVLYEMLSGRRPFQGETAMHTMTAILDQDPPELASSRGQLAPGLQRLVAHCLEKHPEGRFQSMKDLAYDLQNLSTATGASAPALKRRGAWALPGAVAAAFLLALAGLAWAGLLRVGPRTFPTFTRLTHTPGTIEAAFFGADGRTIYFSERVQGGQPDLFVLHPGSTEPRPLGVRNAMLLGVSPAGELAILQDPQLYFGANYRGTLAQVGSEGGSVRGIREGVVNAVWDGSGFATLVDHETVDLCLEWAGQVVLKGTPSLTYPRSMSCSRDGAHLALVLADSATKSQIVTFDRQGRRTVLFTKLGDTAGDTLTGLAWGPDGDLRFSELRGDQTAVWSLSLGGSRRLLWRGEGTKVLMDVARDGRMLLTDQQVRRGVLVQKPGESVPRDISIASGTQAVGFSADGRSLLLMESPIMDGGTAQDLAYLWSADSGAAVRIAAGTPTKLSADGRWAGIQVTGQDPKDLDPGIAAALRAAGLDPKAALDVNQPAACLLFVPTGTGQPFALALPREIDYVGSAYITGDARRVVFQGEQKNGMEWYVLDRQGGAPRAFTPEGYGTETVGLIALAPDGASMIIARNHVFSIQSLAGGEPRPIRGLRPDERPMIFTADQKAVYIRGLLPLSPIRVQRLDLATAARTPVFTWQPGDMSGLLTIRGVFLPPDARIFALNYVRKLSNLYLVEGIN